MVKERIYFFDMTIIITGISSGIGHALALHYLTISDCTVVGIGRNNTIPDKNLIFFKKDLSKTTDFSFLKEIVQNATELILINNAGVIGNIERISEQELSDIQSTIQINTIAPLLLCQYVLQNFHLQLPLTIINISSGAGKKPITGWASYCASKAALDLFSQTIYLEEKERARNIKVYSVAPGVVDTPMQNTIRSASAANFSSLEHFKKLNDEKELTSVKTIVLKLTKLMSEPYNEAIIYSLRDISI